MRYWSQSTLIALLPSNYAQEWANAGTVCPSSHAYWAAVNLINDLPSVEAPHLAFIETVGAPVRRVFVGHPDSTEWLKLERICMIEDDNGFTFGIVDALH